MSKTQAALVNLSVEEESLASIPFAVLEQRLGERSGKIEVKGAKILPDGQELRVTWQVQGNSELGLPTEQDLDIFVALGVLTFQNNFQKTVTFSGREIARILNIKSVHGKFYQRIKLAMDRFIPLRFRAITSTDTQEEVKWLNVFQEASFSLDCDSGRCLGSVTWTDRLIQSMNSGFFRLLDAGRYMELDGITSKHLYRFLAVAFDKTDVVLIDARKLSTENLGILNLPRYFSRLLQTLEPAFDQLIRVQVLASYHIVDAEQWRIALHRHPDYVPERKTLLLEAANTDTEFQRAQAQKALEEAGIAPEPSARYTLQADTPAEFYRFRRAALLIAAMKDEGVLPHAAIALIERSMELGITTAAAVEILDWCEIGIEVCRQKKQSQQRLRNPAGLLIKIARDAEERPRLVSDALAQELRQRFEQKERAHLRQLNDAEERSFVLEYEQFRQELASSRFSDLSEDRRRVLRREKLDLLRQQERFQRIAPEMREREADELILQDLAKAETPPFDKWYLRRRAEQAVLPFRG